MTATALDGYRPRRLPLPMATATSWWKGVVPVATFQSLDHVHAHTTAVSNPESQPDRTDTSPRPLVGVVMGSASDYDMMSPACDTLHELGIPYEARVVSAHRTPDLMFAYAESAQSRGLQVIIAGAGGAAHLPGMLASKTIVPVLGVPVPATALQGLDALLAIVQMPAGIPVGTLAIGRPGAANAALLAAQMLATHDPALAERLLARRAAKAADALARPLPAPGAIPPSDPSAS